MAIDQVPTGNPEFYKTYYFNHQVLQHGNLTGMVCFQSSTPWPKLKSFNSSYFGWLRTNNVYLNQAKFKTSTLVPCGFLVGAHPGFIRRDEAESEIYTHLMTDSDTLPFQLTARTISVPIHDGKPEKYTFQAVVVETAVNQAAALKESFYKLANPLTAHLVHPYTGKYPFVPLLQSTGLLWHD
jgi:hypothetical protein